MNCSHNKQHGIEFYSKIKKEIKLKKIFNVKKTREIESSLPLLTASQTTYKEKYKTSRMIEINNNERKNDFSGTALNLEIILKDEKFQIYIQENNLISFIYILLSHSTYFV